jgi:hypothetical protein
MGWASIGIKGSTTHLFTQPNLLYLFKVVSVLDAATGPIAFPEDAEAPDCVVKHCYRLVKPRHRARTSVRAIGRQLNKWVNCVAIRGQMHGIAIMPIP